MLLREGEALKQARQYKVKNTSGYRYDTRKRTGWASMACAAITSLAIARDELARQEREKGAWGDDIVKNCFALLFLRRATTPMPTITGAD